MAKEYSRSIQLPDKSFLLLGPRGTGKSTLLKEKIDSKVTIDLLISSQFISLQQNPSSIRQLVRYLSPGDWILIDEIQKIPILMDEVHSLYEDMKLNFALTGSSARKLKRGGANLLAGRALYRQMFPLTLPETKYTLPVLDYIEWGGLPAVVTDKKNRQETLATYIETYMRQELIEEGLIRKLDPFARFLSVAGLYNAQILNVEKIARESHVKRPTVDTYFEILEDTLLGFRLPAIQLGIVTKEVTHPKFYFFDIGVARGCANLILEDVDSVWRGSALETQILHEVRAYNSYRKRGRDLYYYSVSGGGEIDLLVETKKKTLSQSKEFLAIEIKYSKKWDSRWSRYLGSLLKNKKSRIKKAIGVYMGDQIITQNGVEILPVTRFVEKLWSGVFF